MYIGTVPATLGYSHSRREEGPRLALELEELARFQGVEDALERRALGPQEEEFAPEAFGFLAIVVVLCVVSRRLG